MKTNGVRIVLAAAFCLAAGPVLAQSYTFDSLSLGPLAGQDGWISPFFPSPDVYSGSLYSPTDPTNVARGSNPGISTAYRPRGVASTVQNSSILGLDCTLGGGADIAIFSLVNASFDNAFSFGVDHESGGINFLFFRRSNLFAGNMEVPITIGDGNTDWYRMLVTVDYAANGGDGSASVFAKDLTFGQTTYTPIAGMQNLNLGLTASNLVGVQPTDMTMYQIRVDGAGMVDNLSVGQTVDASDTPEPGGLVLLSASVLTGATCIVRRRRARRAV